MYTRLFIGSGIGLVLGALVGLLIKRGPNGRPRVATAAKASLWGLTLGLAFTAVTGCGGTSGQGFGSGAEHVQEITTEDQFTRDVLESNRPVLVDFYTNSCHWCVKLEPEIGKLATEFHDSISFVRVNANTLIDVSGEYGIQGVPVVMLFVDGAQAKRWNGYSPASAFRPVLQEYAGSAVE